jgi:hypothetical protein
MAHLIDVSDRGDNAAQSRALYMQVGVWRKFF